MLKRNPPSYRLVQRRRGVVVTAISWDLRTLQVCPQSASIIDQELDKLSDELLRESTMVLPYEIGRMQSNLDIHCRVLF